MVGSGTIGKYVLKGKIVYEIGELMIVVTDPLPDFERLLGREVVLQVEEGFCLKKKERRSFTL